MSFVLPSYFEANGHGTVIFHDSLLLRLRAMDTTKMTVRPCACPRFPVPLSLTALPRRLTRGDC